MRGILRSISRKVFMLFGGHSSTFFRFCPCFTSVCHYLAAWLAFLSGGRRDDAVWFQQSETESVSSG